MATVVAISSLVALNSLIAYSLASYFKDEEANDMALIVAIDTTFNITVTHLIKTFYGSQVNKYGAMAFLTYYATPVLTQPVSTYLANRIFNAKVKSHITLFGYKSLSLRVNFMLLNVMFHAKIKSYLVQSNV